MAIQMISIGEETGELDAMLMKVADFYEDEVEQAVKALTSIMEPIMIVVLGGYGRFNSGFDVFAHVQNHGSDRMMGVIGQ